MFAKLERELRNSGQPRDEIYADLVKKILKERGADIPLLGKITELVDIKTERERQIQNYIELGFHEELGMTEEEYRSSLPEIDFQPESFKGKFDIPVIVETRIPARFQAILAGFIDFIGEDVDNWHRSDSDIPYIAWMQDGTKNVGESVDLVRKKMKKNEIAGNLAEGVALVITHPEILHDHGINIPGSAYASFEAPCLCLFENNNDKIDLDYTWTDIAVEDFGSITRGG